MSSLTILSQLCQPFLPFDASSSVWSDVQPTYQAESSSPMCPIMYAPQYSSAMDIYRTLVSNNVSSSVASLELSPRALALTQHLIQLNPSHYSIWQYRANILLYAKAFESNRDELLAAELTFLDSLAHANMKSYQVWQHRRIIVSVLGDPTRELAFTAENLDRDSKNYHTWSYRQWILSHFGGLGVQQERQENQETGRGAGQFPQLWDGELRYIDQLLLQDVRNNSAWNHRWFCNFARYRISSLSDDEENADLRKTIKFEVAYTKQQLAIAPNNSSAWNYLRGLHTALPARYRTSFSETLPFVQTLISTNAEALKDPSVDQMGRSPPQALEWWLDTLQHSSAQTAADAESALQTAELLVQRLLVADHVRKRFWSYRLKQVKAAISTPTAVAAS